MFHSIVQQSERSGNIQATAVNSRTRPRSPFVPEKRDALTSEREQAGPGSVLLEAHRISTPCARRKSHMRTAKTLVAAGAILLAMAPLAARAAEESIQGRTGLPTVKVGAEKVWM